MGTLMLQDVQKEVGLALGRNAARVSLCLARCAHQGFAWPLAGCCLLHTWRSTAAEIDGGRSGQQAACLEIPKHGRHVCREVRGALSSDPIS